MLLTYECWIHIKTHIYFPGICWYCHERFQLIEHVRTLRVHVMMALIKWPGEPRHKHTWDCLLPKKTWNADNFTVYNII